RERNTRASEQAMCNARHAYVSRKMDGCGADRFPRRALPLSLSSLPAYESGIASLGPTPTTRRPSLIFTACATILRRRPADISSAVLCKLGAGRGGTPSPPYWPFVILITAGRRYLETNSRRYVASSAQRAAATTIYLAHGSAAIFNARSPRPS
ncbi:hypothetical protein ALC57_16630, partial [Trachymyrmex cornetzi]